MSKPLYMEIEELQHKFNRLQDHKKYVEEERDQTRSDLLKLLEAVEQALFFEQADERTRADAFGNLTDLATELKKQYE